MKKMSVDEAELLSQLHRWRDEAEKRLDCQVSRICVAYEAGRDGFLLARFLRGSGIEAHVMHSTSIPVNRDHRRAKTDRLDCHLMMRAFLGWLRREAGHCRMVAVPTAEQEDARRVTRERKGLVREQTKLVNRLKAMFACFAGIFTWRRVGRGWGARKAIPARTIDIRTSTEFRRRYMFLRCASIPDAVCVPQIVFPAPCCRTRWGVERQR